MAILSHFGIIFQQDNKMQFKKYQHLERFGNLEVEGIEFGDCLVFPKIDGTNSSCWLSNGEIQGGSRTRHLSLEKDNARFYRWLLNQDNIKAYLNKYPNRRLYGEFLKPHSLKTYRDDAWGRFYVFDIVEETEIDKYIPYEEYSKELEEYNIDYIPILATIKNGSYEQFIHQLTHNVFLIQDGKGTGEGIVIKRYDFVNRFGRTTWAKIVTSEFKEKHAKEMGGPVIKGKDMIEEEIVEKYVTRTLVEKEYNKILNENEGWSSHFIPRLLNTVFYCLVTEEGWNFVKEFKNPTVNFKTLLHFNNKKVKEVMPEIF